MQLRNNEMMKRVLSTLGIVGVALGLGACTDAEMASQNISKAADYFEINRRIIFYNGITDNYMLTIEGRCSIKKDNQDNQLEVTCKTSPTEYKKHFLGISDNVTYFVEQLEYANVSTYQYRVVFKPSAIMPDIEVK
jgi:hypothetical protein